LTQARDEAPSLFARAIHRIVAAPAVYNFVQRLAGVEQNRRRLRTVLQPITGVLLDVGAGTGNYVDLLPPGARYLWFDNDVQKLGGFLRKHGRQAAILGDAAALPIRERGVDYAMSVAVSHHLTDEQLDRFLASIARICRRGFVFLDALDQPHSLVSRLLWRYDRGSHPRTAEVLHARLEQHFVIEREERYRIYHSYLLCVAAPRRRPADHDAPAV
jgi:SAM-dependent methyltransferase